MELSYVKILGVKIHKVNMEQAFSSFLYLLNGNICSMIFTPNTEMVMNASKDQDFRRVLNSGDLIVPDGIGIIYASNHHNLGLEDRVPGIELMEKILKFANTTKKSVFLLGGAPGISEKAAENINDTFPNIVIKGFHDGYFKEEEELKVIDKINETRPDILFVALGTPKQELWMNKHRKILNAKVAMGVGGALDVWSGNSKRAPKIFRDLGLEWLYRLIREPKRIWRMMTIPKFLIRVFLEKDFSK